MPTTTNYGWTVPALTGSQPNIPADLLTLASAIDTSLKAEETARIAGDAVIMGSRGHAAALSLTTGVATPVPYDTLILDEIPWDAANNWFAVPTAGYYQVNATGHVGTNTTGYRTIRIMLNGGSVGVYQFQAVSPTGGTSAAGSWAGKLAAGDKISITMLQGSGSTLSTGGGTAYNHVDITRIGR